MDSGASTPATAKKPAVKRTNVTPWNAAIMGSKASSSIASAAGTLAASPSNQTDNTSPLPARIVSDVPLPSAEPLQKKYPNGLAGTAKMKALQEQWEKNQADRLSSPSKLASVEGSKPPAVSSHGVNSSASPKPSVKSSSATSKQAPPVISPVPIPNYAFSSKRSSMGMNGTPEAPSPKRARPDTPKAKIIAEAQRVTEAATSQHPGQPLTSQPQAHSKEVGAATSGRSTPTTPSSVPARPPSTQTKPSLPPANGQTSQQGQGLKKNSSGKTIDIITETPDGRRYGEYKVPGGQIIPAYGALIPIGYSPLDTDQAPFICPVQNCRRRVDTIRALGGHFSAAHAATAFNDNGDGTLSTVGMYKREGLKHAPAIIISQDPLYPDASALPEPALSSANQIRTSKSSLRQSPTPTDSALTPNPLRFETTPDESDAVSYLHGFLSQKQITPAREDIMFMVNLPRRRDLPDSWLQHHQGETLGTNHYTCALAYIVGEEVQGAIRCTQVESSRNRLLCRLSERCIRLPAGMPFSTRETFSRILTCVGCRYWSHLQKAANPCDWNHNRRRPGSHKPSTPTMAKREDSRENSSSGSMEPEMPPADPESWPLPNGLRKRRSNPAVASNSSSVPSEQADDGDVEMEDWEFAPGKKLEKTETESIAFSASYLTSPRPIIIADDISINRIRMPPGGSQHWSAEEDKLRYCEVIQGKVQLKSGGQSFAVGQGSVFIIRPGMACTAENRKYTEAVLSCHTNSNY